MVNISSVELKNPFFLAPMAGVNCPAFRVICKRYGASLCYTQMIDSDIIDELDIEILDEEHPVAVQLIGSKKEPMAKASKAVSGFADIIDLNLGCAEQDQLKKQAGSFFVKHPDQIRRIYEAVSSSTDKPITAKIRIGWDNSSINAVEVAIMLEKLGIKAITVHGRTKKQGYSGRADWEIIRKVKSSVSIPIIGNGDIIGTVSAQKMFQRTGCDAIMVGRAAIGNPLIFRSLVTKTEYIPTVAEQKKVFYEFAEIYVRQKKQIFSELNQHAQWFFKGVRGANEIQQKIRVTKDHKELMQCITSIK